MARVGAVCSVKDVRRSGSSEGARPWSCHRQLV